MARRGLRLVLANLGDSRTRGAGSAIIPVAIEAEAMELDGYEVRDVQPWEAASGGKAVECSGAGRRCAASFHYEGEPGRRDMIVRYFDQNNGISTFRVFVAGKLVSEWRAADTLPTNRVDAHSSTRRLIGGVALRVGDAIRIEGVADGGESAALDYVEIRAAKD